MPFGDASYSQVPFSTLGKRDPLTLVLTGTAAGGSTTAATIAAVRHQTLIATGSRGNRSILKLSKGNFTNVVRISDNRIDATIAQGGTTRTGYIDDPNGIVSYELVETIG